MFLFIPRSLCALKRVAAEAEHARFKATRKSHRPGVRRVPGRCNGWPPGHRFKKKEATFEEWTHLL
jgi:hypothetical protein